MEEDVKLGILMSIFEDASAEELAQVLKQADCNIDLAVNRWLSRQTSGFKRTRNDVSKLKQLRINTFIESSLPMAANADIKVRLSKNKLEDETLHSGRICQTLKWPSSSRTPQPDLPTRKIAQPTLHLYRPEDIRLHTPCELIHNALPTELANKLLRIMLEECKTWHRNEWWLFERQVTSPHTTCLYVNSTVGADSYQGEYYYNGAKDEDHRSMPTEMEEARKIIACIVDENMKEAGIQTHWTPNIALANCYTSSKESVGYHSDRLTYLGPRPIIASLSLGVERQFRVRPIIPDEDVRQYQSILGRQISIRLPHNSLLIMKPPMQEEWKHEVPPQAVIDPHPISGTTRINLTFRAYLPAYSPRFTPTCFCKIPTVLRCVQRKETNSGRYFYSCYAGGQTKGKTCKFFEWLDVNKRTKEYEEWLLAENYNFKNNSK